MDYGCGIGSFLHESEKLGFKENTGIDVSEYSISLAQSVAKNSNFFLEKDYSETKKFDCISMIDSLAHIENINLTLPNIIKNNSFELQVREVKKLIKVFLSLGLINS